MINCIKFNVKSSTSFHLILFHFAEIMEMFAQYKMAIIKV